MKYLEEIKIASNNFDLINNSPIISMKIESQENMKNEKFLRYIEDIDLLIISITDMCRSKCG